MPSVVRFPSSPSQGLFRRTLLGFRSLSTSQWQGSGKLEWSNQCILRYTPIPIPSYHPVLSMPPTTNHALFSCPPNRVKLLILSSIDPLSSFSHQPCQSTFRLYFSGIPVRSCHSQHRPSSILSAHAAHGDPSHAGVLAHAQRWHLRQCLLG